MNLQERQQFWQQQVNTWQTTDLSGAAFCKWIASKLLFNEQCQAIGLLPKIHRRTVQINFRHLLGWP